MSMEQDHIVAICEYLSHNTHLFGRHRRPPHSVRHLLGPDGLVDHFKPILPLLITLWFLSDRRKKQWGQMKIDTDVK